jgi:hypothetical protein
MTEWDRMDLVFGAGNESTWYEAQVRSPSAIYAAGFTLMTYEGWDLDRPRGIGVALAVEQWLHTDTQEMFFMASDTKPPEAQPLKLENLGLEDIELASIVLVGEGFAMLGPEFPVVLQPRSKSSWGIHFTADNPGTYTAELVIESNAQYTTSHRVYLIGHRY